LIVLSGPQKKCQTDNAEEGILAIAHHDDLQFVENVVCPSQNAGIYTGKMSNAPHLGTTDRGCNRGVFAWKTNALAR
jgi:hypothetical protein